MNLLYSINEFLNYCSSKCLSKHTLRAYEQDLTDYQRCMQRLGLTMQLTRESLYVWFSDLHARNVSAATIKRRIASLRVYWKWLVELGKIKSNPFERLDTHVKLPSRLPKNLASDDLKLLVRQMKRVQGNHSEEQLSDHTLKLSIMLMLTTGIRVGELCSIRLSDLDFGSNVISIHGKGNRERIVYVVNSDVERMLREYVQKRMKSVESTGFLFVSSRGRAVTPDSIRQKLLKYSVKAGIERRITPHMLRHTAATQLIEAGVDIRFVQKLLGHSSISTTEIYTHVTDVKLRKVICQANIGGKIMNL